jgi:4-diphosphocytidyl-2-C-methyl-D-erythritol kinase
MSTRIRSHAKINLGLAIGPVRADGYHALVTIYQTLAVHDFVEVTAKALATGGSQITIDCSDKRVPCDARNTCWKMVERALARMKMGAEVHISIGKRLPVQGGLGAGSANAAAALLGLERELGRELPAAERLAIAAEVGSDVPLFLIGGTVLGVGRGEEVSPMADLPQTHCVLAVPSVGVSTPQAFRDWDLLQTAKPPQNAQRAANSLTGEAASDRLEQLGRMWASALAVPRELLTNATGVFPATVEKDRAENLLLELVRAGIVNDFEQVVFTEHPSLRGILDILKSDSHGESPATYAALSGSGSALFGLYDSAVAAGRVADRLVQRGIATYRTATVGRAKYWRDMMVAPG